MYENGTLIIREVYREDDGKYGCIAGNSGGFEREEAYLRVASEFTTFTVGFFWLFFLNPVRMKIYCLSITTPLVHFNFPEIV